MYVEHLKVAAGFLLVIIYVVTFWSYCLIFCNLEFLPFSKKRYLVYTGGK